MAMEWKDYSQKKPHKPDWYLVWVELYSGHEGYPDTDYWDVSNWRYNDTLIRLWCEIKPPPSNDKQEEQ